MKPGVSLWVAGGGWLFWGWATGSLALAFPLAVLTVGPRYLRRRFDFATPEFHRALDLCWVLFLGGMLLIYGRESMGNVLRAFARWLPAVFAPALLAQVWSARGRVPLSAILPLPWWRRQVDPVAAFDGLPPFLVLCLLSASLATGNRVAFCLGVLVIGAFAFWVRHPAPMAGRQGAALALWMAAAAGGWYTAEGIGFVQQEIESRFVNWATRFRRDYGANRVTRTAIGRTGDVRGSSRVAFRVRRDGPGGAEVPERMRLATFAVWRNGSWHAPSNFERVDGTGDEWLLDADAAKQGAVYVEWVREVTGELLPLPPATRAIGELPADRIERTPMGAVRATVGASMVGYRADLATLAAWESEPGEEERAGVPPIERPALDAVIEELRLAGRPIPEALTTLEQFFARRFRYTTDLQDPPTVDPRALTPLGRFLLGHRAGHCEFFATAAVLILREAGVPARYARGYLVAAGEKDGPDRIVRESHAHAWARVWTGRNWEDFDPTPPAGLEALADPSGAWAARLSRAWNDLRFAVSRWWWLGEKRLLRQAYWLVLPLLALLLWRLRRVREVVHLDPDGASNRPAPVWPGLDSEWFGAEAALSDAGWGRVFGESTSEWERRMERVGWPLRLVRVAVRGRRLHLRLRFDPRGLDDAERAELRRSAEAVLGEVAARRRAAELSAAPPPQHEFESGAVRVGSGDPAADQLERG